MAGIENVVAPQGTALTLQHATILKRYADEIVLCFDSDAAGRQAAIRSMDDLEVVPELYRRIDAPFVVQHGQLSVTLTSGVMVPVFSGHFSGAWETQAAERLRLFVEGGDPEVGEGTESGSIPAALDDNDYNVGLEAQLGRVGAWDIRPGVGVKRWLLLMLLGLTILATALVDTS